MELDSTGMQMIAIIALCASHPRVEHELDERAPPGDINADRIIERAMALLEAVDRYRFLLHDPRGLDDPPRIETILLPNDALASPFS